MNYTLEEYIKDVKSQLCCNNDLDKIKYITYDYSEGKIDKNINYFKKCLENGLYAYKALLFFHDYLKGNYEIESYTMVTMPKQKDY